MDLGETFPHMKTYVQKRKKKGYLIQTNQFEPSIVCVCLAPKKTPQKAAQFCFVFSFFFLFFQLCRNQNRTILVNFIQISDSVFCLLALFLCAYLQNISFSVQDIIFFHSSMRLHYRTSYCLSPMPQLRLYMFRVVSCIPLLINNHNF